MALMEHTLRALYSVIKKNLEQGSIQYTYNYEINYDCYTIILFNLKYSVFSAYILYMVPGFYW